jgi:ketosteroid isomerase-like protein
MTADTRSLAETYFRSWKAKDFDTLRSILADDVTFRGPMGTAEGVDDCLKGLEAMAGMMTDLVIQKIFVDGDDVLTWYEIHTASTPPLPTANWSRVKNGKISRIRAAFDPRPITGG